MDNLVSFIYGNDYSSDNQAGDEFYHQNQEGFREKNESQLILKSNNTCGHAHTGVPVEIAAGFVHVPKMAPFQNRG